VLVSIGGASFDAVGVGDMTLLYWQSGK
jgi:hypothetical protein